MSAIADLEMRVARLEARAAIGELVSAYALACDAQDIARLAGLFTQDASFGSPSGIMAAEGRDAIVEMFVGLFRVRGPGYHWTHDHFVRWGDDPDAATGLVPSHAETSPNGRISLAAMRYEDDYRFEQGCWRFARRVISFLYYVPARDFCEVFNSEHRLVVGDRVLPADYPEGTESWLNFGERYGRVRKAEA